MGKPKVDVEAHLEQMNDCGESLRDTAKKFVEATGGIFGPGGSGSTGMAADVKSAGWAGRAAVLNDGTKALENVADNAWGELAGFTEALSRNAADLGGFTALMGSGIQAYGDMAITARDTYVKLDQQHENQFIQVDLPDKQDSTLSTDITVHKKTIGQNLPEPSAT